MQVTIDGERLHKLEFLQQKLNLTPGQQVRQAVDEYLKKFDFYALAGGTYPPGIKNVEELLDSLQSNRSDGDSDGTPGTNLDI